MGKDVFVVEGVVEECLPNATFRIKITDENYPEMVILAHVSGKMRMNYIRIIPGDRVQIEMTPYDLTKGRIIYRFKEGEIVARGQRGQSGQGSQTGQANQSNQTN